MDSRLASVPLIRSGDIMVYIATMRIHPCICIEVTGDTEKDVLLMLCKRFVYVWDEWLCPKELQSNEWYPLREVCGNVLEKYGA